MLTLPNPLPSSHGLPGRGCAVSIAGISAEGRGLMFPKKIVTDSVSMPAIGELALEPETTKTLHSPGTSE
jgi:hypothetical protein